MSHVGWTRRDVEFIFVGVSSFRWTQSLKMDDISFGVIVDFKETGVSSVLYGFR